LSVRKQFLKCGGFFVRKSQTLLKGCVKSRREGKTVSSRYLKIETWEYRKFHRNLVKGDPSLFAIGGLNTRHSGATIAKQPPKGQLKGRNFKGFFEPRIAPSLQRGVAVLRTERRASVRREGGNFWHGKGRTGSKILPDKH